MLTDYDCNPLIPGEGDAHLDMRPEVTFYSDRKVRGLVGAAVPGSPTLGEALRRVPAAWFLHTPWPPGPGDDLAEALAARSAGPPVQLADNPPVYILPLKP